MPFDSSGRASLPASTWVAAGQVIRTESHNPPFRDIESMLSSVLLRDGRAGMVGALPMGGFPITNLGASADPTAAATVGQTQNSSPVGSVISFAGLIAPPGWLFCFGQAVGRAEFPDLFATIGTAYGPGDGSTTFNVPDCRDVVVVGRGNMGGTARGLLSKFASTVLGNLFGVQEHILSVAQMPSHDHGGATGNGGSHNHTYTYWKGSSRKSGLDTQIDNTAAQQTGTTSTAPNHTHPITAQGGGEAHPNVQPSLVMNMIIRASYT